MYIAKHFNPHEELQIFNLVKSFPFVTLISKDEAGQLSISHIPVVTEFENGKLKTIKGHFAQHNPQVGHLASNSHVTVIFGGPHTYVTPLWYKSGRDVPTWNYCVVHVQGLLQLNNSFEEICTNLKELTKVFESGPEAWQFELPSDLVRPEDLTAAIVAFSIAPEKIEAKFKLSQNRPMADRLGVIEGLGLRKDEMSLTLRKYMQDTIK